MTVRKALLTALAVSFVLHAVVLDYWRGRVSRLSDLPAQVLPARLEGRLASGNVPVAGQRPGDTAPLSARAAPERRTGVSRKVAASAVSAPVGPAMALAPETSSPQGSEDSPTPAMSLSRPWSRAEGLAGYRLALALAASWPDAKVARQARPALLRLRVAAQGDIADASVIESSGSKDFDDAALRWLQTAAALAAVPQVLVDSAFELDLLIE